MITIVNYGVGNPGALVNMFEFIGYDARITDQAEPILDASHLILPGVGAFDAAMQRLKNSRLIPSLEKAIFDRKIPLLGVCLGMQLLGRRSEEGVTEGLGWIAADTVRMRPDPASRLKVPFMGWAYVQRTPAARLFDAGVESRFYFTHSYQMRCEDQADVAGTYKFDEPVDCAVQHNNIYGVQFHPEKSHRYGMRLLRNFVEKSR
ncbi:MAG: imidazole glycerol phosphate synthase, glutamine amidotransferase subunit [Nitrobacter sp. 62-13]|jgi:glutamine amidotransferase|uniref:imidazole glycerol phosphate synthase subunit HisH n=1 Tax=Nitrobacter sp. 62-13 TaxID=1895797 RepID=UPI0009667E4A|nr:imidazole glycerol phosphate synthase subunit HisH [Nitrobacter sp. 62-13]OJU24941.1 MAG: imidazole glycerol phosphate synthase, glutamine amidotransferase subunit [Nitrobacter sp. 62-13]